MKKLRRFIIDTDTGADDAWAIVEALRATDICLVEAITTVCGNFPLDLCVKNAQLAEEAAGTYLPPVYRGMEEPLNGGSLFCAYNVHGEDGLGGMNLPASERPAEKKHAVDVLLDLIMRNPGEMELITIGPLTNIASAILREPSFAENVKQAWILGGAAGKGNLSDSVEFNVGTDPEAAAIVAGSGMKSVWITWDTARGDTEITPEEVMQLLESGSRAAEFCALCTRQLRRYYKNLYGRDTYGVVDSVAVTTALYPEIMTEVFPANCSVGLSSNEPAKESIVRNGLCDHNSGVRTDDIRYNYRKTVRGQFHIKRTKSASSVSICTNVSAPRYKNSMFQLLLDKRQ